MITSYVEVIERLDVLTKAERALLQRAQSAGLKLSQEPSSGRYVFSVEPGASRRAITAALPILEKLNDDFHGLPEPPPLGDWRVWRARQMGLTYDRLADVLCGCLRARTPEARRVQAVRAVKHVEEFRRRVPAAWFNACAAMFW